MAPPHNSAITLYARRVIENLQVGRSVPFRGSGQRFDQNPPATGPAGVWVHLEADGGVQGEPMVHQVRGTAFERNLVRETN